MHLKLNGSFRTSERLGEIQFEKFMFPSKCEPHIKINSNLVRYQHVMIHARIDDMNDLMLLLLATDALRRMEAGGISVFIPFLPFARQDRVMVAGEPFSLKVLTNILNAQNYEKILVYDLHSDVAVALLDNCKNISNHDFVSDCLKDKKDYVLVCPDAGAYKKIDKLARYLNYKNAMVMCNKVRDLDTGRIESIDTGLVIVENQDCYIVDDICDGGMTFIMIAKELKSRGAKTVNLIVSHGIFSKGIDVLTQAGIDNIYTTNSTKFIETDKLIDKLHIYEL